MAKPLTVERLAKDFQKLVDEGKGDYLVFLTGDEEANGYHGCWFAPVEISNYEGETRKFVEDINKDLCTLEDKDKAVYLG